MKWFLILVIVSVAAASYYEPKDGDYQCCMCGDPLLRGYDGAYFHIQNPDKYLLTRFDDLSRNTCKFQVRCVTAQSMVGVVGTVPVWLDWCGIAFHQHKADHKFFRNWVVGQNLDLIGERGQGISGLQPVGLGPGDERLFPYDGCNNVDMSTWHPAVEDPACCPATYKISIDKAAGVIRFRSACCGWAVDFWSLWADTCVVIHAEAGNPHIESFKGQMEGLCGNMDGDSDNDWTTCDGTSVAVNDAAAMLAIELSCADGDHDGQGYKGGTKLDKIAAQLAAGK